MKRLHREMTFQPHLRARFGDGVKTVGWQTIYAKHKRMKPHDIFIDSQVEQCKSLELRGDQGER